MQLLLVRVWRGEGREPGLGAGGHKAVLREGVRELHCLHHRSSCWVLQNYIHRGEGNHIEGDHRIIYSPWFLARI